MAISERDIWGAIRTFPRTEVHAGTAPVKPRLYSQKEIIRMVIAAPPAELSPGRNVETPVGSWSMDGDVAIFDSKSPTEIAIITKVDIKQRLAKLAKRIFQIY